MLAFCFSCLAAGIRCFNRAALVLSEWEPTVVGARRLFAQFAQARALELEQQQIGLFARKFTLAGCPQYFGW